MEATAKGSPRRPPHRGRPVENGRITMTRVDGQSVRDGAATA
jgi:hypothetical protein